MKRQAKVGQRIRLVRNVERFPHFTAPQGMTGTVVDVSASEPYVTAKMDEHIVGAEAWENEILWFNDPQDFYEDTEELPQ